MKYFRAKNHEILHHYSRMQAPARLPAQLNAPQELVGCVIMTKAQLRWAWFMNNYERRSLC